MTADEKAEKAEQKNNMEALDEIKEEEEKEHPKKKTRPRSHSLDLKLGDTYSSVFVETPTARRISLLIPSRKESD